MLRKLKSSQSDIVMKDIGCTGFHSMEDDDR